jgi:two-component system NtrC family sensor kinase
MSAATSPKLAAGRARREGQARARSRTWRVIVAMAVAIVVIAALAWWDETRESEAAFEDFAHEQATLAASAAADVATRLDAMRDLATPDAPRTTDLTRQVARIERPGELVLLIFPPGRASPSTTDGREVTAASITRALYGNDTSLRLDRDEAASLGLPARTAVAGLARIDEGPLGRWGIAVVATASKERDREMRARSRLLSSVVLASGLVFAFGTMALRKQRKEMELERELALADLQLRRDDQLVRAGRAAMMGTMAMGVAHEIGTPLGVISGRAEQLLARTQGDDRAMRSVQAILQQTERIDQVVRGFLDVSRGGQPTLARTSARDLVTSATRLVGHRFEKADVALSVEPPEPNARLHCDVRLVEHALVNLMLNACEACDRGGRVEVRVSSTEHDVAFSIVDDGAGIPADHAARALEPFFTTKPAGKGSGLGLAITHEIVKMHRGTLTIEPVTPHGTRVCLRLPLSSEP